MLKYSELPENIKSPITGEVLYLLKVNETDMIVCQELEFGMDTHERFYRKMYDDSTALYTDQKEFVYISYKNE